jgi:hypothetical protein
LAAYLYPPVLLPRTAEVVDMEAAVVDMAVEGSTAVGDFVLAGEVVLSSRVRIALLRSSQVDNAPLHSSQVGIAARHSSQVNIAPGYSSQADTTAISGTAVGGITALARAGYGRTITASTCGRAIKGDGRVRIS